MNISTIICLNVYIYLQKVKIKQLFPISILSYHQCFCYR